MTSRPSGTTGIRTDPPFSKTEERLPGSQSGCRVFCVRGAGEGDFPETPCVKNAGVV